MHVMHYLSYQYVHKSQSCETWVPQSQCRCVKILSQIYTFLANYSILQFLTLCPIILPRSPYYSFDICHYSHGDVHKHILYIGYNNDSMSFSLVTTTKYYGYVSLLLLWVHFQIQIKTEVDSLLVLTALLIVTNHVCVAVIFYLMPAKHGQARPVLKNSTYYFKTRNTHVQSACLAQVSSM